MSARLALWAVMLTAFLAPAETRPGTPEDLAAFVAGEIPKWQGMARLAGIAGE